MPRFVILEHDWPSRHYDLMLEFGSALRSWRISKLPVVDESMNAEPIGDHRLEYLDYEGPVGGDRGHVRRMDAGSYEMIEDAPNRTLVTLDGMNGRIQLELLTPSSPQ